VVHATAFGRRVVVSDPDAIKRVLVDNADNYVRDDLQQRILLRTTGHSLFSAEGEAWRAQRRLFAPLFTRQRLATYGAGMTAAAAACGARLADRAGASTDISAEMARTTVDVIVRTLLPDAADEDPADVAASIRRFADGAGAVSLPDLLGLPPAIPGLRRLRAAPATRVVRQRAHRIVAPRCSAAPPERPTSSAAKRLPPAASS
jgi:cytochrome P450